MIYLSGVSISTKDQQNTLVILLRRVSYFSPPKKKQLVVMMSLTKNMSKNLNENVKAYWFWVMQILHFSQFFTCFLEGLHRICSRSNLPLFIACKLCGWLSEPEWKVHFLEWKTHSFVLNLVPRRLEIALVTFVGLWNFKIFWRRIPPDPHRGMGLKVPCWYSWVFHSNLLRYLL